MLTFAFSGDHISDLATGTLIRDTVNRLYSPGVSSNTTSLEFLPLNLLLSGGESWMSLDTSSASSGIQYTVDELDRAGNPGDPGQEFEFHCSLATNPAITANRGEILRIGQPGATVPATGGTVCRLLWTNANDGSGLQRLNLIVGSSTVTGLDVFYAIAGDPLYVVVRGRGRSGIGATDDSRLEIYVNGSLWHSQDGHPVSATQFPYWHNQAGTVGGALIASGRTAIRNIQNYNAWTTSPSTVPSFQYVQDAEPVVSAAGSYSLVGAASNEEALSDNSETSYLGTSVDNDLLELDYTLPTELQGQELLAVHARTRVARGVDANVLEFNHTVPGFAGSDFALLSAVSPARENIESISDYSNISATADGYGLILRNGP